MNILYEDNHLLVAVKPPGMPVVADQSGDPDFQGLLKTYLKQKYHKPGNVFLGIVHRLDRPVGGVMVFARTSKAASRLFVQVRERTLVKIYLAVVRGIPEQKRGSLADYLVKDQDTRTSRIGTEGEPGAKAASLEYEVLRVRDGLALLQISLHTGRHHQIRVQLASRGWPIWGDARYSPDRQKAPIALWAWKLSVKHPITGERMEFSKDVDYEGFPYNLFS